MTDAGVWYVIIGCAVAGGFLAMLTVEVVLAVWAGRRQYPRGRR